MVCMMEHEYLYSYALAKKSKGKVQIFETPYGLGDFVPVLAESTTKPRMLKDRFADVVNVKDFTTPLAAAAKGSLFVPQGEYACTVTNSEELRTVADALTDTMLIGSLTVNIAAGHYTLTAPVVLSPQGGDKLSIVGAEPTRVSLLAVGTTSGQSGAWSVPLTLADATGVTVGDYLIIRGDNCVVGTGTPEALLGVWKVTAVSGNVVTVLITEYVSSFPEMTLTSGYADVLKTVIKFQNCDGFVVRNASVGLLNNVAVIGNASDYWQSANVSGTEKGTHGIHVGGPTVAVNGKADDENALAVSQAHLSLGMNVGVSDFDQQGIVASTGGSIYGRWCASCSNRRRGWYAETNASIQCKNSVGSGNYLDGYIGDLGGSISCNISTAVGNALDGFFTINGGIIGASRAFAAYNGQCGFEARSGFINAGSATARGNGLHGVYAQQSATIFADAAVVDANGSDGLNATCAVIRCLTATTLTNNTRYGARAATGGIITMPKGNTVSGNGSDYSSVDLGMVFAEGSVNGISTSGGLTVAGSTRINSELRISRNSYYFIPTLTSIGNLGFNLNGKNRLNINSETGAVYGEADNAQDLGRAANRWQTVYAGTATINTSDARCKENVAAPDDALMRAWSKVGFKVFQFKDAVEKKGADARLHIGVIAQEVIEAFASEGLDANRYGLLCYDKWEDEYEDVEIIDIPKVVDDEGNITPAVTHIEHRLITPAGDRYGIRYEEALALEAAYQRWRINKLESSLLAKSSLARIGI